MCDLVCEWPHVVWAAHASGIILEHACGFQW